MSLSRRGAAVQMTSVIPIVFGSANDPVGSGLVASVARPGGNVTGLPNQAPNLVGKIEVGRPSVVIDVHQNSHTSFNYKNDS
jgi:hypothetical protein